MIELARGWLPTLETGEDLTNAITSMHTLYGPAAEAWSGTLCVQRLRWNSRCDLRLTGGAPSEETD